VSGREARRWGGGDTCEAARGRPWGRSGGAVTPRGAKCTGAHVRARVRRRGRTHRTRLLYAARMPLPPAQPVTWQRPVVEARAGGGGVAALTMPMSSSASSSSRLGASPCDGADDAGRSQLSPLGSSWGASAAGLAPRAAAAPSAGAGCGGGVGQRTTAAQWRQASEAGSRGARRAPQRRRSARSRCCRRGAARRAWRGRRQCAHKERGAA
jgi:hypothetical protein